MARKKSTKSKKRAPNHQWVYIMSNASMPGLIKIGMTTTSPLQRSGELGSATGVPTPFTLEYALEVRNAREVEQLIHKELSEYRVNKRREFFELDVNTAIRRLRSVARRRHLPFAFAAQILVWGFEAAMVVLALLWFWPV